MPADRDELGRPLFPDPPLKKLQEAWALEAADRLAGRTAHDNTIGNFPTDIQTLPEAEAEIESHEDSELTPLLDDGSSFIWVATNNVSEWDIWVADAPDASNPVNVLSGDVDVQWSQPVLYDPDGDYLVMGLDADGNDLTFQIFRGTVGGGEPTRLFSTADKPGGTWYPHWSPDGSKFAFVEGDTLVSIANADGSGEVQVVDVAPLDFAEFPVFSADGESLFIDTYDGALDRYYISKITIDGGVFEKDFYSLDPLTDGYTYFPDVDKSTGDVCFVVQSLSSQYSIRIIDSDTAEVLGDILPPSLVGIANPRFSPSGEHIAFSGGSGLHTIDRDGSNEVEADLSGVPNTSSYFDWSRP